MSAAAQPLLAGALTDFALADVLQVLELGGRSGVLTVDGGPLGAGRVNVRRGRVVAVATRDHGNTTDLAGAVASLLDLPRGRWAFHASDPSRRHPAAEASGPADGESISAVLVEAARSRDERARAGAAAARRGADVPRLSVRDDDGEAREAGCLTAAHLRVLAAVDGVRDVRAIAAALRCEADRVGEVLATLRALGLVEDPERDTRLTDAA